jgi:crossover junction endodeoxyribonuclease RuvC
VRVLGIDPGLTRCGVGVVDVTANRVATLVAVTVVRTPPTMDLDQRLLGIALGLDELISEHRPESIAIERVFAQHNVSTVMGTAQVSGIALLAAITGYGQAEKKQVGTMVAKILGLAEIPKPADAADALALAICHAWRSPATSSARPPVGTASASGMTRAQQAWRAAEKAAGAPRRLTR